VGQYVSIWRTSSAGRPFGFAAFARDIEGGVLSACGDDARKELGREEKGMEMFCSSENERVRCGSGGRSWLRTVAREGEGEDAGEGNEGNDAAGAEEREGEGGGRGGEPSWGNEGEGGGGSKGMGIMVVPFVNRDRQGA
jgi:hypothetical protein